MIKKAEQTMLRNNMLPMRSVVVGLSGGADSVALTHILCRLSEKYGFTVYAAHVNHGLRGADADDDEEFSRRFAEELGIRFFSLRADVREEAKRRGVSEELAGRGIRYDYFDRLLWEHDIEYVATAHHKNDNAETLLMNFIRGSGMKGLCGIPYRRDRIIRPLLDITRREIEEYCADNNIGYVIDATNLESAYTRNKVRNILIPMLEREFNPSLVDTITGNAQLISNEEDYIRSESERAYKAVADKGGANISALTALHSAIAMRVIRKMAENVCGMADVSSSVIAAVLELAQKGHTGSRVDIARGAYAMVEYGRLIIKDEQPETEGFEYELKIGEKQYIPELRAYVYAERCDKYSRDGAEYFGVPENSRLIIRNRRDGDRFCPWGMNGTKKLKTFMIDEKIPRDERDRVGILTVNGEIAWIMGYRRDRRFKFDQTGIKISVSIDNKP